MNRHSGMGSGARKIFSGGKSIVSYQDRWGRDGKVLPGIRRCNALKLGEKKGPNPPFLASKPNLLGVLHGTLTSR